MTRRFIASTRNRNFRKGVQAFRNVLKNVDPATREEIADVLEEGGPRLRNLIKLRTPIRTGRLSRGIKYKVLRRELNLTVGILSKTAAGGKLFYGHIVNYGRKGGPRRAIKRTKSGKRISYTVNVKSSEGNRFLTGAGKFIRPEIGDRLAGIWDRILRRADRGV